jgi:hypothetical protein
MVMRPYRKPYCEASSATRAGNVRFASARNSSISSGECGCEELAAHCLIFSFACSTHSSREFKNANARRVLTDVGYDKRISPDGRTDMDMRTVRRLCDRVTTPNLS